MRRNVVCVGSGNGTMSVKEVPPIPVSFWILNVRVEDQMLKEFSAIRRSLAKYPEARRAAIEGLAEEKQRHLTQAAAVEILSSILLGDEMLAASSTARRTSERTCGSI